MFFVVGCPRSGTTLIRALLDAHPDVAIPTESHFIPRILRRSDLTNAGGDFDASQLAHILSTEPRFRAWGMETSVLESAIRAAQPTHAAAGIEAAFDSYAHSRGKSVFGDKTPNYVLDLELLVSHFPGAKFVIVVRDGRDVALSLLDQSWGPSSLPAAAAYWRRRVLAGYEFVSAADTNQVHVVTYEDLVQRPESGLEALCQFLGLSVDDAMLDFPAHQSSLTRGLKHPESHQRLGMPITVGTRNWQTSMTSGSVACFEALAADALCANGYTLESPVLPRGARMVGRSRAAAWRLRQLAVTTSLVRTLKGRAGPGSTDSMATR